MDAECGGTAFLAARWHANMRRADLAALGIAWLVRVMGNRTLGTTATTGQK